MPAKIFIGCRRDDAGIRDGLAAKFGRANVFMDVHDPPTGQRFDMELSKALDACNLLIALSAGSGRG